MTREKLLEASVKELGQWLSRIAAKGIGNPKIAEALERGRKALRKKHEDQIT